MSYDYEKHAETNKQPHKGKCKRSRYAAGDHCTVLFATHSVLDGGLPGDSAQKVCVDCGKRFKERWFIPKDQPNELPTKETV